MNAEKQPASTQANEAAPDELGFPKESGRIGSDLEKVTRSGNPMTGESHKTGPIAHRVDSCWTGSLQSLAVTVVIALFIITFIMQAFTIPSESMENTLLIGDYLLVDKVGFGDRSMWPRLLPYTGVKRGDIVVFKYPVNTAQHFVKRVIAVPGDRVHLANKRAWVNGRPAKESANIIFRRNDVDEYRDNFPLRTIAPGRIDANWWSRMPRYLHEGEIVVPPGSYFVLGDNRDSSLDSRYWGFVPRENIVGRPLVIYFSLATPPASETGGLTADGKLASLVFTVTHLWELVRWHRMLKPVQ